MIRASQRGGAPGAERPVDRRRSRGRTSVALVTVLSVALSGCGLQPKGSHPDDDPRSAVHQLLRASVGQGNGQRACALLTEAARERMAETLSGSCRGAMDRAIVGLQGSPALGEGSGRAAEDVELAAEVDGDRATVTVVTEKGHEMSFDVSRLTEEQLKEDLKDSDLAVGTAPESDWRVDRGAEQLVTETNRLPEPAPGPDAAPDPRG